MVYTHQLITHPNRYSEYVATKWLLLRQQQATSTTTAPPAGTNTIPVFTRFDAQKEWRLY
jgi:hypothetical protein